MIKPTFLGVVPVATLDPHRRRIVTIRSNCVDVDRWKTSAAVDSYHRCCETIVTMLPPMIDDTDIDRRRAILAVDDDSMWRMKRQACDRDCDYVNAYYL
jgi:hypothetical protein